MKDTAKVRDRAGAGAGAGAGLRDRVREHSTRNSYSVPICVSDVELAHLVLYSGGGRSL